MLSSTVTTSHRYKRRSCVELRSGKERGPLPWWTWNGREIPKVLATRVDSSNSIIKVLTLFLHVGLFLKRKHRVCCGILANSLIYPYVQAPWQRLGHDLRDCSKMGMCLGGKDWSLWAAMAETTKLGRGTPKSIDFLQFRELGENFPQQWHSG